MHFSKIGVQRNLKNYGKSQKNNITQTTILFTTLKISQMMFTLFIMATFQSISQIKWKLLRTSHKQESQKN